MYSAIAAMQFSSGRNAAIAGRLKYNVWRRGL